MKTWTQSAEERLEVYLRERGRKTGLVGDDLADLTADWRSHIYEEVELSTATVVSLDVLEPILGKLGNGDEADEVLVVPSPGAVRKKRAAYGFLMFFGVMLPAGVVAFEWVVGFCASVFFAPVSTWIHGLLLLSVPAVNWWILRATRDGRAVPPLWAPLLMGFVTAVGLFYAWLFVPLLVPSVMALLFFGMGLLSLTPIIVFFVSLRLGRRLKRSLGSPGAYRSRWWSGMAAGLLVLGLLEGGGFFTRINLQRALSEDPGVSEAGVVALRTYHDEDVLLQACYEGDRGAMVTDISGWLIKGWSIPSSMFFGEVVGRTDSDLAREVFYRATGKSFNAIKPPVRTSGLFGRNESDLWDDFEWDGDLGGEQVGVRVKGVSLQESRLDGSLDGVSGLGYCEWTTVFRNTSGLAREARFQMQLPPGGVASRVTLWVNGEPREAAFASKGKVREPTRRSRWYGSAIQSWSLPRDRNVFWCSVFPSRPMVVRCRFGSGLLLR